MIQPTPGRIVWFFGPDSPGGEPRVAIIVKVFSDYCINVAVFDYRGGLLPDPPTSVELIQDDDVAPGDGPYCVWMPHQKVKAAKAEALEKKLRDIDE